LKPEKLDAGRSFSTFKSVFLRGNRPAIVLPLGKLPALCRALELAGYEQHQGPRTTHEGELEAWRRDLDTERQVHVQIVAPKRGGNARLYAHTEPRGFTLKHLIAALLDRVSYQAGAKVLRSDLDRVGGKF
jgi:hypothetical protein